MKNRFVIFDRDGTLIDHVHYLIDIDKVKFKTDAVVALLQLKKFGFKFGVISNQSVIGRGIASATQIQEINSFIENYFLRFNISFEFFWMCPHSPEQNCECRKPKIALGVKAINDFNIAPQESFFIGDQESDVNFSNRLGLKSIQICDHSNKSQTALFSSNSLSGAIQWIGESEKWK